MSTSRKNENTATHNDDDAAHVDTTNTTRVSHSWRVREIQVLSYGRFVGENTGRES
jgi:hypothetical protein